jgi:3-oxoacyl-[acyl-carrier protein] reductase
VARFDGYTTLVTGAAAGLGRALARGFAAEGSAVIALDRDSESNSATAAAITAAGGRAVAVTADITDDAQLAAAVAEGVTALGGVDVLVNCAGLHTGRWNLTTGLGVEDWKQIFDVNVIGPLRCSMLCRCTLAKRPGVVLNISAISADVRGAGAYGASKVALNKLTESLAREFAADGIRVVGLSPGMVGTESVLGGTTQEMRAQVLGGQLVSRMGTTDDVVSFSAYLCSEEASFVTGHTYILDGGFLVVR